MNLHTKEIVLLLVLVLAAAGSMAGAQSDDINGTGLRFLGIMSLTEVEDLYGISIGSRSAMLSPDGRLLAWSTPESICVLNFEQASATCFEDESQPVRVESALYWSPTSQAIAFHEDSVRFMNESDIWLLDLASGQFTNLTDDGISGGNWISSGALVYLDLRPVWNPATGDLYFFRETLHAEGGWISALYRIRASELAAGAEPELVADLTGTFEAPFPVTDFQVNSLDGSADISPDGTALAFIGQLDSRKLETGAVWLLDLATSERWAIRHQAEIARTGVPTWYREEPALNADILEGLAWLADNQTLVTSSYNPQFAAESLVPAVVALNTSGGALTSPRDLGNVPDFRSYMMDPYTPEGYPAKWTQQLFSVVLPGGEAVVYSSGVVPTADAVGFSAWVPDTDGGSGEIVQLATIPKDDFTMLPMYHTSAGESDGMVRVLCYGYLLDLRRVD